VLDSKNNSNIEKGDLILQIDLADSLMVKKISRLKCVPLIIFEKKGKYSN
jgi:hypothetical protein